MSTDTQELIRDAKASGFTVTKTKRNGHFCFESPSGEKYFGASTPSDTRSVKNERAHLKRMGMEDNPLAPDLRRRARLAAAERSGLSVSAQVLAVLQSKPDQVVTSAYVRERVGKHVPSNNIGASLYYLNNHNPDVFKVGKGEWIYRTTTKERLTDDEQEPPFVDPLLVGEPAPEANGHNGHIEEPEPVVVEVPAEVRVPIRAVPTVMPNEVSAVFEAVSHHKTGALLLRDENGDFWLAHPLKIDLPVITLGGTTT